MRVLLLLSVISFILVNPLHSEEPQIERGEENILFDSIGYVLSTPKRIVMLNAKVDTHRVTDKTETYLADFIKDNPDTMDNVKVRLNQWTPAGEMKRLVENKKVSWWWRVFPGVPVTLFSSLTGRLLGGDHYNPYTDTIHIYSDDPAIALHEAGHAKDFSLWAKDDNKADLYALGRVFPAVVLNQEFRASDEAINYLMEKGDEDAEIKSYSSLYPAYGTYLGDSTGMPYGVYIGAVAGHIIGFWKGHERRVGYSVMNNAIVSDHPVRDLESDPVANTLLKHDEGNREKLLESLREKGNQT